MKKQTMLLLLGCLMISGCATRVVERLDTAETVDLSTRWNDTDSRVVASEMVKEALARPWVDQFQQKKGKPPMVIIGTVLNKTHDHIPTETFTKDLERELFNSGRVTFVASKSERDEIREERADQQENASKDTVNQNRNETGANYMLKGVINSFEEQVDKKSYKYFQVTLEMIDMEKNTKVWFGDKKIKKLMTKKKFGF
ncbi:MAG: penicillin-binding protein activator LpoB [Nitrospirota bacterium]